LDGPRDRKLAVNPTLTRCSKCPTFEYEEDADGAVIVGSIFSILCCFFACMACCWCASKSKEQSYQGTAPPSQPQSRDVSVISANNVARQLGSHMTHVEVSPAPTATVVVMCPPGATAGQPIRVMSPHTGQVCEVIVPANVAPGQKFGVAMPALAAPVATAVSVAPAHKQL